MPKTNAEDIQRLTDLANQVRGLFKEDATEAQRMLAGSALVDLVLVVVMDLKLHTHAVERLAETITPEQVAHLQSSVAKLADATETLAELERRRGPHA